MDSDNKMMIYQIIFFSILSQIILFVWYYLTIPTIKNTIKKSVKPSITSALIKFLIFMLPFYIYLAYNIYLFKQHEIAPLCQNLPAIISYGEKMCFAARV